MRKAVFALALSALLAAPASASTITITAADIGEGFTVTASGVAEPGGDPVSVLLNALVADYIIAPTSTTLVLDITLANTSSGDSSLRGYGFSANPDVQFGTATGSAYGFDTVSTLLSTNNSVGNIENCVADQVETECTGLSSGGLGSGQVDTHTLTLLFDGMLASLQLGDADTGMYFRFQSVGAQDGSAKIFGNLPGVPTQFENPPTPVPEPASMLTLGLGLSAIAAARRRQQRKRA
jgi:hypothetical protein